MVSDFLGEDGPLFEYHPMPPSIITGVARETCFSSVVHVGGDQRHDVKSNAHQWSGGQRTAEHQNEIENSGGSQGEMRELQSQILFGAFPYKSGDLPPHHQQNRVL